MNSPLKTPDSALRDLLGARAAQAGPVPADRVEVVRRRVSAARARRRTTAALSALAVVAVVLAGLNLGLGGSPQPVDAPATLAGHAVPRTITQLGYSYRYVRGVQNHRGPLTVTVPASPDVPLFVRWVGADPGAPVTMTSPTLDQPFVTKGGGFAPAYLVQSDRPTTLHVRQSGGRSAWRSTVSPGPLRDTPATGSPSAT